MRRLTLVVGLMACGGRSKAILDGGVRAIDAYDLDCGVENDALVETTTGGSLYTCATKGAPGVCTGDDHGFVQCYDECDHPPHDGFVCIHIGSPYVLMLGDGTLACFCVP